MTKFSCLDTKDNKILYLGHREYCKINTSNIVFFSFYFIYFSTNDIQFGLVKDTLVYEKRFLLQISEKKLFRQQKRLLREQNLTLT